VPESHPDICCSHARATRVSAICAVILTTGLLIGTSTAIAETTEHVSLATLPTAERTQLEGGLKSELQKLVDRQSRLDGQGPYIRVLNLRIEPLTGELVIDMSKSFLPLDESYRNGNKYMSGDFQGQMQRFASVLSGYVEKYKSGEYRYNGYTIRIEGRDLLDYYPGDRLEREEVDRRIREKEKQIKESEKHKRASATQSNASAMTGLLVVTNPGHGYTQYYLENGNTFWALQRPVGTTVNGISEDFMTQTYENSLTNYLNQRTDVTNIISTRSNSTQTHPPTGEPWWKVAARYHLEQTLPNKGRTIWHTRPDDMSRKREENEDINSRPYYANYLGADSMISIHMNAAETTTARGGEVYYSNSQAGSQSLASNVLCGMTELVRAQEGYQDFPFHDQPILGTHGEYRLASMPAALVEVAYKTNVADAAALKDPAFREAAMKGVAKGYRIFHDGKVCTPFKITSIPDVTIQRPGSTTVPVNFEGFPFFPVVLTLENIVCPPGNTCSFSPKTYATEQESPIIFTYGCGGTSSTVDVARWRAQLTDADNVKTNTVEFEATCLPNSGTIGKAKPTAGDAAIL